VRAVSSENELPASRSALVPVLTAADFEVGALVTFTR
jgi:hypothetical protein